MSTSDGQVTRDYGMITRQLTGKAGQFLVQVAGISHFGTEAASEFLANKKEFTTALRTESISLEKRTFRFLSLLMSRLAERDHRMLSLPRVGKLSNAFASRF